MMISLLSLLISLSSPARIGMNAVMTPTTAQIQTDIAMTNALGVKAVRLFFPVYTYTPSGDSAPYWYGDNVTQLQNKINLFSAAGYRITVTISGTFCGDSPNCLAMPKTLTTKRSDGSFQTEFDTYLTQALKDIGSSFMKVSAVEIWNEWDNSYGYLVNGKSTAYTAAQYTELFLHGGSLILKAYNPKLEVVTGSVVTCDAGDCGASRNLLAQMVSDGASKYADAFGFHPYVSSGSELNTRLTAAKTSIASTGKNLYLTEWGQLNGSLASTGAVISSAIPILQTIGGIEEADYYLLDSNVKNSSSLLNTSNQPITGMYNVFQTAMLKPSPTASPSPIPTPKPTPSPTPSPTPTPTKSVEISCNSWNWITASCAIPGLTKVVSATYIANSGWCDETYVHNGAHPSYSIVGNMLVVQTGCRGIFNITGN
jgi:hypothetical protein